MAELARRTTICEMRRAGNSVSDIIKSTGYAKSTVYRVVAAFDAEGKVQRSRHSPRSDRKRTKTFLAGLKRTLKSDPSQPMSKLASDGKVMPPHFIEAGLKINTAEYLKILKDVLMPWIRRNYDPFKVMLVQDSAPAHGAKKVQDFLKENLPLMVPKDIWPSSSPDLNVCDYWLFGVIEGESNVTSHPSVNSLKAAIRRAFRNLDPEDVKRSCSRFRSRISQIIDAKGSHIE